MKWYLEVRGYPIISHKGAPFFDFSDVNFGLKYLHTPTKLCGTERIICAPSLPHNSIGVGRFVKPKYTIEKSKKGAPLCEIIGYFIYPKTGFPNIDPDFM